MATALYFIVSVGLFGVQLISTGTTVGLCRGHKQATVICLVLTNWIITTIAVVLLGKVLNQY